MLGILRITMTGYFAINSLESNPQTKVGLEIINIIKKRENIEVEAGEDLLVEGDPEMDQYVIEVDEDFLVELEPVNNNFDEASIGEKSVSEILSQIINNI